mgnify:FL=1|jgi:hypothetical protein
MNRTRQVKELETIKEYVNSALKIDIKDGRRQRSYVYGRAIYFQLSKDFTTHSLSDIGSVVNKDHASVLHGLKIFKNFRAWDETYLLQLYHEIRLVLKSQFKFANNLLEKTEEDKFQFLLNHYINLKQKYYNLKRSKEKIS